MRRLLLVLTTFLTLAAALAGPAEAAWLWPVRGEVITQYRNGSDPYAGGQHRGIDIAAAVGTPVVAAASGEVRFAGTAGSSGLTVSVRTGDGYDTSYLHLSSILVGAGEHVAGGERLGAVGTTGERSATAPHLHFGVRKAGSRYAYVDPLSLLPPAIAPPPSGAPTPAPAPAPTPPAPSPAPAPRAAPGPGPAPRPVPAPGRVPRAAPSPRRALRTAPAPRWAPKAVPAPGRPPRAAPAPNAAPRLGLARHEPAAGLALHSPLDPGRAADPVSAGSAPSPTSAPGRTPAFASAHPRLGTAQPATSPDASPGSAAAGPAPSSSGPDLGWAFACAGLLLAAGILGLTGDRNAGARGPTTRGRSRRAGRVAPAGRQALSRRRTGRRRAGTARLRGCSPPAGSIDG
jgi:pyruvate/2-oxoglutarate dehydrogenase complex dihydrolipoamide acyltransferase (E2) component